MAAILIIENDHATINQIIGILKDHGIVNDQKIVPVSQHGTNLKYLQYEYGLLTREIQLLQECINGGWNYTAIGKKIQLQRQTIRRNLMVIYQKVGVNSRNQLIDLIQNLQDIPRL